MRPEGVSNNWQFVDHAEGPYWTIGDGYVEELRDRWYWYFDRNPTVDGTSPTMIEAMLAVEAAIKESYRKHINRHEDVIEAYKRQAKECYGLEV